MPGLCIFSMPMQPDLLERDLPDWAGFGIATEWTKYFRKIGNVPVPEWFQGLHSSVEDGNFAAILAADSSASAAAGEARPELRAADRVEQVNRRIHFQFFGSISTRRQV